MKLQSMKRQAVPLHAEVAAVIRHRIMSGEAPPGSKLPALSELTKQLGVARMTVVQAMNSLEDEGLIERFSGRGTFVRKVRIPNRHKLHMKADIYQIYSVIPQLEVSVLDGDTTEKASGENGRYYRHMKRLHSQDGKPFICVDIHLDNEIFERAPDDFTNKIVIGVLEEIGVAVASARQKVTISYADFELARLLKISVNSAVFRIYREFYDSNGDLIYSAKLIYPGDLLELEIEFNI